MKLVSYSYFPGWTQGDYTEWESSIDELGLVTQHMNPEEGKTKRKHGVDIRTRQLDVSELTALTEILSKFDSTACAYLQKFGNCIEDVESIGLQSERFGFAYTGALLTTQQMAKEGDRGIDPDILLSLISVWRHVDRLQPYSLLGKLKKR